MPCLATPLFAGALPFPLTGSQLTCLLTATQRVLKFFALPRHDGPIAYRSVCCAAHPCWAHWASHTIETLIPIEILPTQKEGRVCLEISKNLRKSLLNKRSMLCKQGEELKIN
jgi:hypothetical protein